MIWGSWEPLWAYEERAMWSKWHWRKMIFDDLCPIDEREPVQAGGGGANWVQVCSDYSLDQRWEEGRQKQKCQDLMLDGSVSGCALVIGDVVQRWSEETGNLFDSDMGTSMGLRGQPRDMLNRSLKSPFCRKSSLPPLPWVLNHFQVCVHAYSCTMMLCCNMSLSVYTCC